MARASGSVLSSTTGLASLNTFGASSALTARRWEVPFDPQEKLCVASDLHIPSSSETRMFSPPTHITHEAPMDPALRKTQLPSNATPHHMLSTATRLSLEASPMTSLPGRPFIRSWMPSQSAASIQRKRDPPVVSRGNLSNAFLRHHVSPFSQTACKTTARG